MVLCFEEKNVGTFASVLDAIRAKALGATTREVVEEFAVVDGEEQLVKRKVTCKQSAPDVAAAKLLLSLEKPVVLSEAELQKEKRRLLEELRELEV